MQFVDTNVFIRFLTGDDPMKAQQCKALFERTNRGEIELTTSESVIAEIVFILSSKRLYNQPRRDIRARLYPILSMQGLKISHRRMYLRALDIYEKNNLDFEDALTVAQMERQALTDVYSYDQDFDKIQGAEIKRLEP
ncbi:MAG: PIN domain-containing protein [Caldilineaceae bacterium]|nr:PIN domain-containing protein [Caldilineaceae bacterium]